MPRIKDAFLDCAIYLYPDPDSAKEGSSIGGSGFLVSYPSHTEGLFVTIAVTNRHVIERGNPTIRLNNRNGTTTVIDVQENAWIFHEEDQDLAAFPIPISEEWRYSRIKHDALLTKEIMAKFDIGPGSDTFLVGRFIHRDGKQTNIPTVRFGHLAQMPSKIPNEEGREQESFLVETRSIGGYSGSPVFVHIQPYQWQPNKEELFGNGYFGPALLGVDWGHTGQTEPVYDASDRETDMTIHANTGLSMVIPAWRLRELLDCQAMQRQIQVLLHSFKSA